MGRWEEATDGELLGAVCAREPGAWTALYARFERLITACVRKTFARYTSWVRPEDVEDVVSTVCLNLVRDDYKRLRTYDATRGYRLSSWIGLIATNTALDALRRREPAHVSLESGGPDAEPIEPAAEGDAATALIGREDVGAVLAAISDLPDADREFIALYYDEDLPPDTIAERLGVSVNTVYSRKNKLRDKIRRAIESRERKIRKTSA